MAHSTNIDIFSLLAMEKQAKVERKAKKQSPNGQSNAGNLQMNSKLKNGGQPPVTYNQRKSRGQQRAIYNEGVSRIPGAYNKEAKVQVEIMNYQEPYDMLNLTANVRTDAL